MPKFTTTVGDKTITAEHDDATAAYRALYDRAVNVSAEQYVDPNKPLSFDLECARTWGLVEVQRLRGEARKLHVPDVPGQELVYANKLRQAEAFLSAKKPDQLDYPALSGAEARVRGLYAIKMAELIIAKARAWQTHSDTIDAATLKARTTLEKAKNLDEIVTTLAGLAAEIGG